MLFALLILHWTSLVSPLHFNVNDDVNPLLKYDISDKMLNDMVDKSVLFSGNYTMNTRLQYDNNEIVVGVIGGSISCGTGSTVNYLEYLEMFRNSKMPRIKMVNGAMGGSGALSAVSCLEALIGDVDVIIIEFSINEQNSSYLRELYQKTKEIYSRAVVIALDLFSVLHGGPGGRIQKIPPKSRASNVVDYGLIKTTVHFDEVALTPATKVAMEYGVSVLSLRSALFPHYWNFDRPFTQHDMFCVGLPTTLRTKHCKQHFNEIGHFISAIMLYEYIYRFVNEKVPVSRHVSVKERVAQGRKGRSGMGGFCYNMWGNTSYSPYNPVRSERVRPLWDLVSEIDRNSEWWYIKDKTSPKPTISTRGYEKSVVGKPIRFVFDIYSPCRLVLTAVSCSRPPFCQLGTIQIFLDGHLYYSDKQYSSPLLRHEQGLVWSGQLTRTGKYHLVIASHEKSDTGFYGVELIGLNCL